MVDTTTIQAPGRGSVWRPLGKTELLPDLQPSSSDGLVSFLAEYNQVLGGGRVCGERRCSAIGLHNGDCSQQRTNHSRYCYYHDKVQTGVISTFQGTSSTGGWHDAEPRDLYPVWPLPINGYVLLERELLAA